MPLPACLATLQQRFLTQSCLATVRRTVRVSSLSFPCLLHFASHNDVMTSTAYRPRFGYDIRINASRRKPGSAKTRPCAAPGCREPAENHVPKCRENLEERHWLCRTHLREHNEERLRQVIKAYGHLRASGFA